MRDRPERAKAKITSNRPSVATTSERKCAGEARCLVEISMAALENMTLATTAPKMQPATWAGRYAAASRHESPRKAASTKDTTGLKCPPETGPNIKMMAKSPAAVAAAFSNSCRPVLPGESCWAAMPEPMTTAARNALPKNSASRRRQMWTLVTSCQQQDAVSSTAQQVPSPLIPDSTGASDRTV